MATAAPGAHYSMMSSHTQTDRTCDRLSLGLAIQAPERRVRSQQFKTSAAPRLCQEDGQWRGQRQQANDQPQGPPIARLRLVRHRHARQQCPPQPALLTERGIR